MAGQDKEKKDLIGELIHRWQVERPLFDTMGTENTARIVRLNCFISRDVDINLAKYQLSIGEFDVLAALLRTPKPHQLAAGQLQNLVMISSGGLTNRLNRLETRQLLMRLPDHTDRRGVIIKLTEKGEALIETIMPTHLTVEKKLVEALSHEEQIQLSLLLKKLLLAHEHKNNANIER